MTTLVINNNDNYLTCKAPVCAKKDFSGAIIIICKALCQLSVSKLELEVTQWVVWVGFDVMLEGWM